jgi:hypothetical protein
MSTEVYYDAPESPSSLSFSQSELNTQSSSFFEEDEPVARCSSPVGFCSGFCPPVNEEMPHVICMAACKDTQLSWEMENHSMTMAMIGLLREDPHPMLDCLMKRISHYVYDLAVKRHELSRILKKRCKESTADQEVWEIIRENGYDIENYQDPQIASLKPLNMRLPFTL